MGTLMRKPYFFRKLMLFCSVFFFVNATYAVPNKDDVDVENVKAPPRDVKDILRILEQTKPDLTLENKAKKIISMSAPSGADSEVLNFYYLKRGYAYQQIGDSNAAAENFKKVIAEYPSRDAHFGVEEMNTYAIEETMRGNYILSNEILEQAFSKVSASFKGWKVSLDRAIITNCLLMGDFDCANAKLNRMENSLSELNSARNVNFYYRTVWESGYEWSKGRIFLSEGKFLEAERAIRRAMKLNQQIIDGQKDSGKDILDIDTRVLQDAANSARGSYSRQISMLNNLSSAYSGQKRLVDAEFYAREALILAINRYGVNSNHATTSLLALASVISEQGRQKEAVLLSKEAIKLIEVGGVFNGSPRLAQARRILASALVADGQYAQADKVFVELFDGLKGSPDLAAKFPSQDLDWALALIKTGKSFQAAAMTSQMLSRDEKRLDKNSPRLAILRAFNAAALQVSGQGSQALPEFKQSIPILVAQARSDVENSTESVRQTQRMKFVLEEYLASLAQQAKLDPSGTATAEAFQIADLARGSGVQRALTSSAARANISDPQLASLARREQDLQQRVNTLSELLTGLLSASADQQLPGVQAKIRTDIASYKSQREDLKREIERKFPDYAELVEPKPASIERTQKALKPDEVLVSWYFGDNVGYVWAITKDKPAQFAQLSVGRSQMAKEVAQLRKALDPGVATIDEIPPFDVALANQLYQQVLAPVQSAFTGKKVMLTVPHAELGQLPLSLLVTKPTAQPTKGGTTPFIGYKTVPWLTREIAVAQVPSVTALTALRSLPAGNPNRKNFIGFGDPYFSSEQERSAQKQAKATQLATRGIPLSLRSAPKTSGVSSAELALLPRLPDTSTELEEIGKAIGASDGDIFLHQQASVKQVMSTDLSNRKVVMFATHGLVPGELNGLTQPALALSSPDVTGDKDDGLLTMDKVITLKLDADWVVLSACNTAAGEGAGSEAVSGLGRAFFFAGAKALLVSNWPVDSVASRTMMTDLFKNQQKAQGTSKAELLRQAMLNQIDQGGMKEGGSMKYAYAHPLFWAPFVVVGD
jgi:CHAT domain-containing protein